MSQTTEVDAGETSEEPAGPAPLDVRVLEDVVVYPTIRVGSRPGKLLMGVFDADGGYVEDTALNRRSGEVGAPVPRELYPDPVDADVPAAIYAGPLYYHFGHFLLESLARAWYARRHPEVPLVWAGAHNWGDYELADYQREILGLLSITNPTRIIAAPTRFDTLHVPDLGYRYDDTFHPEHAEFLGRYAGPPQRPGQRLWLSRSQVNNDAHDLNAVATERRLRELGWTIAHPESLTVTEQLDLLAEAEIVAGEEGSAFHTLILLRDVADKQFHIIRRTAREHGNLHTIGNARGVNQTFHSLKRERVLRAEGRDVSKVSPDSTEMLDVLRVPVPPKAVARPETALDRLLTRLLLEWQPERVLDVGASSPDFVLGSTAPTRVAVSRRFAFDLRAYPDEEVEFLELDLDQYAALFHDDRAPFDLIRIDGDDLEDRIASFAASRQLAHDDTHWILGAGGLAARTALAVEALFPGYAVRRVFIWRQHVYVVERAPAEPASTAEVAALSPAEVKRRRRRLPATVLDGRAWVGEGLEATLGADRTSQLRRVERRIRGKLTPKRSRRPGPAGD